MQAHLARKWQAIGIRCSIHAPCSCVAVLTFMVIGPSAFGTSVRRYAEVFPALIDFTMIVSSLNALFAIGMMIRFRDTIRSAWL